AALVKRDRPRILLPHTQPERVASPRSRLLDTARHQRVANAASVPGSVHVDALKLAGRYTRHSTMGSIAANHCVPDWLPTEIGGDKRCTRGVRQLGGL